jgi:glycerophosphoryl diester phosphodiesterase
MPIVIAHRGASAYLPEHTAEAKVLAHAMGADYLEQDVVLTKDDVPVVLHDIYLDTVTDVARIYPNRHRPDGRYYVLDFTLDEIRRLNVTERVDIKTNQAVFPNRFPAWTGQFSVSTLADELALIRGLNQTTRRDNPAGVYPELKLPAWHREQGRDLAKAVLEVVTEAGYRSRSDRIFLQCFDFAELKRVRHELRSDLPLIQLIGDNKSRDARSDLDALCRPAGLKEIAAVAQGIGPSLDRTLTPTGQPTSLTADAHGQGLAVHPYTLRADSLPRPFGTLDDLHAALFDAAKVDGVFTDYPDRTRAWLAAK